MNHFNDNQLKYGDAIKWLLSDNNRGEGRTYLMSAVFIEKARDEWNEWVEVFDHYSHRQHVTHDMYSQIHRICNDLKLNVSIDTTRQSIKITGIIQNE